MIYKSKDCFHFYSRIYMCLPYIESEQKHLKFSDQEPLGKPARYEYGKNLLNEANLGAFYLT